MSTTDNLRVLRQQAYAARRGHIARTLGQTHQTPSAERLPKLQRIIDGLDEALDLTALKPVEDAATPTEPTRR